MFLFGTCTEVCVQIGVIIVHVVIFCVRTDHNDVYNLVQIYMYIHCIVFFPVQYQGDVYKLVKIKQLIVWFCHTIQVGGSWSAR